MSRPWPHPLRSLPGEAAPGPAQGDTPGCGLPGHQPPGRNVSRVPRPGAVPPPQPVRPVDRAPGWRSSALSLWGPHRLSWSSPPAPSRLSHCQVPPPPGSPLGLLTTPRPFEGADEGSVQRELQESPSRPNKSRHVMLSSQNRLPALARCHRLVLFPRPPPDQTEHLWNLRAVRPIPSDLPAPQLSLLPSEGGCPPVRWARALWPTPLSAGPARGLAPASWPTAFAQAGPLPNTQPSLPKCSDRRRA